MTARTASAAPPAAVLALGLALGLALAAVPAAAQDGDGALPEDALALVNGRPVPRLALENIVRQIEAQGTPDGTDGPPDRERILEELIDLEILTQAAEGLGLDEEPDIAAALKLQYTQTMANAYLAARSESMDIDEAELRAEYERQTAGLERDEYRASHILLESEADARAVIDALADGGDFETLAAERSIDSSGENGGDLGWFQGATMEPGFARAVAGMEIGATSREPVRSDFGWHVIRLDDRRGAALPDYASVRPGLRNLVLRDRLAEEVERLRRGAEIRRR